MALLSKQACQTSADVGCAESWQKSANDRSLGAVEMKMPTKTDYSD